MKTASELVWFLSFLSEAQFTRTTNFMFVQILNIDLDRKINVIRRSKIFKSLLASAYTKSERNSFPHEKQLR